MMESGGNGQVMFVVSGEGNEERMYCVCQGC